METNRKVSLLCPTDFVIKFKRNIFLAHVEQYDRPHAGYRFGGTMKYPFCKAEEGHQVAWK